MIHLTTTEVGEGDGGLPAMGSFVYAMPDVRKTLGFLSRSGCCRKFPLRLTRPR